MSTEASRRFRGLAIVMRSTMPSMRGVLVLPSSAAFHLTRIVAALACGVIPTAWLFATPGWPLNHDMLRVFRRIGILAGQWRVGHLFPVWSTTAFGGYGSASPILYHKVFTFVSALIFLLTDRAKLSVCLTLVLVLATLFLGVAKACRILLRRDDPLIEATSATLAVFATYTTTDWLTRGAVAESTAVALSAWVFAWCLSLIDQGRFSRWLGPFMAAIYFAHPVIALYCALPLVWACVLGVLRWRKGALAWMRPALTSLLACAALVVPCLIAILPYARFSSLQLLLLYAAPRATHIDFCQDLSSGDAALGGRAACLELADRSSSADGWRAGSDSRFRPVRIQDSRHFSAWCLRRDAAASDVLCAAVL